MRLDELLRPEQFHGLLLALYGAELMPAQLPVLVSQWSKYYFALVWREALAGRVPAPDGLQVMLDGRGLPVGLEGESYIALDEVVALHLTPVVKGLADLGRVSASVLWGNAGDCLAQTGDPRAYALLGEGPLAGTVDANGRRRRCCLSYKVQWVGHCEYCPLA